jgi:hypothetical protein
MGPLRESLGDDAELRAVFSRLQAFDSRVREAVHDVPVPTSLEQRLLAATGSTSEATGSEATGSEAARSGRPAPAGNTFAPVAAERLPASAQVRPAPAAEVRPPDNRGRHLRSPWWLAAAATAAVLLLSAFFYWGGSGQTVSEDQLVAAVQNWTKQVQANELWKGVEEDPPAADHPLSAAVRAVPRRWMTLRALDDPSAAVYEVVLPRGDVPALVFVVKTKRDCGLSPVPYRSLATGGVASGLNIAAWQTPDLLYVLVVPGDGPSPQRYVPSTPAV